MGTTNNYPYEQEIAINQVSQQAQSAENLEKTLPGKEDESLKINWLGSSYSGADIKVVAHLYGAIEDDESTSVLREQKNYFEKLRDGLNALTSDVVYEILDWKDLLGGGGYDILLDLVNGDPEIARYLNKIFLVNRGGGSTQFGVERRASRIYSAIASNKEYIESMLFSIDEKLNKIDEFIKQSSTTLTLATLQTISVQSHRQKSPVRALGMSNVKGWVRGYRTIAGSMIFTMFNEHAFAELIRAIGNSKNKYGDPDVAGQEGMESLLADQLPPIDLTIVFANEYGSLSKAAIYGVEFMNNGYTLSIEDLLTEEVVNFVARDLDPIVSMGNIGLQKDQRGMHFDEVGKPTDGSKLLFTNRESYDKYLHKIGARRSLRNR